MQTRRQFLKAVGVVGTGLALSKSFVGDKIVRADNSPTSALPYLKKGKITRADRLAAATRVKALRAKAGLNSPKLSLVPGPNGYLVPDYFGTTPNWALSPLPTVVAGAVTAGGMQKFINGVPGLYTDPVNTPIASVKNNLGQYIPVAQPNTTAYPAGGLGYTAVPTITITDPSGINAVATAVLTAGKVTSVTIVNGGTGYSANPHIVFSGGGPGVTSQAIAYATVVGGAITAITVVGADYYEIALVEYREQMHGNLPPVTGVWPTQSGGTRLRGYMQTNATDVNIQNVPSYLGPVIIAQRDRPVRVKFTNLLPTGAGGNLFIPCDTTYMGAGMGPQGSVTSVTVTNGGQGYSSAPTITFPLPAGGVRATAVATLRPGGATNVADVTITNGGRGYLTPPVPVFSAPTGTPPYQTATGTSTISGKPGGTYAQNRATFHLHGGTTPWISDGTPHQWTTPAAETSAYPKGVSVRDVPDMPAPGAGSMTFYYTNQQSARLMFYHDHAYGITRLNVYAGEAAGYVLTDAVEQDFISGSNNSGANPGLLTVLPGVGTPLVIQDKTFVDAAKIGLQDPTWNWGTNPGTPGAPGAPVTGDLWWPHVYMPNQNPYNIEGANPMGRWDYGPWFWPIFPTEFGTLPNPYASLAAPWEPPVIPGTPNPSGVPESFMDTPLVNGTAYPTATVPAAPVRFRILNACNDRFLNLQLYQATGIVGSLTLLTGGSGYTDNPVVTIAPSALPGAPATANATVDLTVGSPTFGQVVGLQLLNVGSGYAAGTIAVTIAPPTGVGGVAATASAIGYTVSPAAGVGMTEVGMAEACPGTWPAGWPAPDGRDGGVPDPALRGPAMIQIGTEGGFLPAPAVIKNRPIGYEYNRRSITVLNVQEKALFLAPAERADVIIDFTPFAGSTLILYSDAPAPVPAFDSRIDYYTADPDQTTSGGAPTTMPGYGPNTRTIMQIKVSGAGGVPVPDFVNATMLTNLNTAIPAAFRTSQDNILVPQAPYNAAYNPPAPGFPADASVYAKIQSTEMTFKPLGAATAITVPFLPKTIQELFTADYGRMNATLGVELPFTTALIQTTIPLGYIDPAT